MLPEEVLALIADFRKETEDLVQANVREIYKAKSGTKTLASGSNNIVFSVDDEINYSNANDYGIRFRSAIDTDGFDIKEAISITAKTTSGFTVNSPGAGELKWETYLITPDFGFWTE